MVMLYNMEKSKSATSESKHMDTNETRIACNSKGILDDVWT